MVTPARAVVEAREIVHRAWDCMPGSFDWDWVFQRLENVVVAVDAALRARETPNV